MSEFMSLLSIQSASSQFTAETLVSGGQSTAGRTPLNESKSPLSGREVERRESPEVERRESHEVERRESHDKDSRHDRSFKEILSEEVDSEQAASLNNTSEIFKVTTLG